MGKIYDQISRWVEANTLIRFDILKGRGVHQTVHGRILNYDEQTNSLLVYNDDDKAVLNLTLNEIENISPAD